MGIVQTANQFLAAAEEAGAGVYVQFMGHDNYALRILTDFDLRQITFYVVGPLNQEYLEAWLFVTGERNKLIGQIEALEDRLATVNEDRRKLWDEIKEMLDA